MPLTCNCGGDRFIEAPRWSLQHPGAKERDDRFIWLICILDWRLWRIDQSTGLFEMFGIAGQYKVNECEKDAAHVR